MPNWYGDTPFCQRVLDTAARPPSSIQVTYERSEQQELSVCTGTWNDARPLWSVTASPGVTPGPLTRTRTPLTDLPLSWSMAQTRSSLKESFVTISVSTTANANCERSSPFVCT